MTPATRSFLFMNVGHALDHYCMLIFTTAVLTMEDAFADGYGRLLLLTTWSFVFFGGASIPAGWLGDRWSRRGMMVVFLCWRSTRWVADEATEGWARSSFIRKLS